MTRPASLEAEFPPLVDKLFGFLRVDYQCSSEAESDAEGVTVRFQNETMAVEVRLELEERVYIDLVPLLNGKLPPRFNADGTEPFTRFPLSELVALCDPTWHRPAREFAATEHDDLREVLTQYAAVLRRCGDKVLRGDQEPFVVIEASMRRRLIRSQIEEWASFVDRVRQGFSGGIGEYSLGVATRGQLEDALRNWRTDPSQDPWPQLAHLDRAFQEVTEAISEPAARTAKFAVVPAPNAMRWWRRPKHLIGPLRDYFARSR